MTFFDLNFIIHESQRKSNIFFYKFCNNKGKYYIVCVEKTERRKNKCVTVHSEAIAHGFLLSYFYSSAAAEIIVLEAVTDADATTTAVAANSH